MPLAETPITTSLLRRLQPGDLPRPFFVVVLGAFLGLEDRALAAGHDRLDDVGIGAERGRHLRGFEDAEPAAGPGPDEDNAPVLPDRLGQHVGAKRDAIALPLHGRQHLAVFGDHEIDNATGREFVDRERGWIDRLGRQALPLRTCGHLTVAPVRR